MNTPFLKGTMMGSVNSSVTSIPVSTRLVTPVYISERLDRSMTLWGTPSASAISDALLISIWAFCP